MNPSIRSVFAGIGIAGLITFACASIPSCRAPAPAPGSKPGAVKYEPQQYEIANGSNVIAQLAADIEIEADLHLADRPEPVRAVVRLKPGTWLMPEQMYAITEGGEVVCNDRYCEAAE